MQKRIALRCGIRRVFVALLAACAASAAGGRPAVAEVLNDSLKLTTQTDVDNFAYTEVTGFLWIQDDGTDPITNLDGLSGLTSVGTILIISHNDSLTNVDGLSSLTSVGRGFYLSFNDSLTDVDGLCGLTSVGDFYISSNDSLTNVDGLCGLTSVGGFYISSNDSLTNVDGLSGLTSVGYSLDISFNDSLTNVDGLSGLTSVVDLAIEFNDSLTEFCGLYPLLHAGEITDYYFIHYNAANPTAEDILNGGPCDPADTIAELFAEHAISKSEAKTLLQLADNSLEDLASTLDAMVQDGILTPCEAQLLFVIASNWQAAM